MEDHVKEQSQHFEPDLSIEKAESVLYIHKAITYKNYNPLWKSILSVTSLKEFDTNVYSIFDQQNILVLLYDEIIDSILHIIDRLDLSVDKEKAEDENDENTTTTDLIFDIRPPITDEHRLATISHPKLKSFEICCDEQLKSMNILKLDFEKYQLINYLSCMKS
ncbi:unnamed protein product [Rotaria sordida]|uniref:DNA-PKcs N-terminal domain-containing protein n=1 Tax=Rotaria sordida TaxID=392033 RepID=A0A815WUN4_9BILA|nr:unnamed protein product [Rotaria sordida]CAF1545350.1 unnamed protein product [Rotaria sordida]